MMHARVRARLAAEVRDDGRHEPGREVVAHLAGDEIGGHPRRGAGGDRVDEHALAHALEREDVHEPDDAELRRGVVGLAEVAVRRRARGGDDDASVALLASITGQAAWVQYTVPMRCTARTASKSSSVIFANVLSRRMPALLTSTSTVPKRSTARSTSDSRPVGVGDARVMGDGLAAGGHDLRHDAVGGRVVAVLAVDRPPTSLTTTLAPRPRERQRVLRARAPLPAPVTSATRPSKRTAMHPPPRRPRRGKVPLQRG